MAAHLNRVEVLKPLRVRPSHLPSVEKFTPFTMRYNNGVANARPKVMQIHKDHIDPRWEEGRDYQLICGLDTPLNFCERDPDFNVSKNNRFLPWRVAKDELGCVPIEQGDLCQFLDLSTGGWVLEEFLGEWWFAQTKSLCGASMGGKTTSKEQLQEMGRKSAQVQIENKIGIHGWTDEQKRQRSIRANKAQSSEQRRKAAYAQHAQKWQCTVTGYISTAAGLSHYQRHKSIDLNRRILLTSEECAFIFLWGDGIPEEWLKESARLNLVRTGTTNLKKVTREQREITAKKLNNTLWMSLVTGNISTAAGIHNINKKAGLDKETSRTKRSKLTPEESAFIFLWAP